MKQLYNGIKQDEYYTPKYAVEIIIKYLKPNSTILCPFDTKDSEFVKVFKNNYFNVIYSHISENKDFFAYTKNDMQILNIDYIISNPPFSLKTEIISHLEYLDKPFAMLLPISQMLETKKRQEIYKRIDLQVLHPNKRIKFINGITGKIEGSPTFTSGYLCKNVLHKNLVFDNFNEFLLKEQIKQTKLELEME